MKPDESTSDDVRKEIEELRPRAKAGDPEAQIEIAGKLLDAIRKGKITRQEGNGDAFRWVRTAEINPKLTDEQRKALAETLLHHLSSRATLQIVTRLLNYVYRHGEGIVRGQAALTLGKALNWRLFKHSRRHGRLEWIKETLRDIARSLVWFRRAARCGNAMGAVSLYEYYLCGTGVLANDEKAHYWKNQATELNAGHSLANYAVHTRMENIESRNRLIQNDFESAREQLFQAESENSVREAMDKLMKSAIEGYAPAITLWCAEVLDTGQKASLAMAKVFLRDAIRQGHPAALALAGECLLTGGRGVRQDIKLARQLLDRAVALGNAHALAIKCRCAIEGLGEPQNSSKGWQLWMQAKKLAMTQNDGRGLYELFLLRKGMENIDAVQLLRLAAEAGNVRACLRLGRSYYQGWDVPVDRMEARIWLQKAAFRRNLAAQYTFSELLRTKEFKDQEQRIRWLEKALHAGSYRAGIVLGMIRMNGNSSHMQNWQEAERLFRRFCPLEPETGYSDSIITHFLAKPMAKRSERDRRFLNRARDYLRNNEPARAAHLFRTEDPDFAAECEAMCLKEDPKQDTDFEIWLKELKISISKAESDWQSVDKALRRRAGEELVRWARFLSSPHGRSILRAARHTAERPDAMEVVSRCYWRAAQTLLQGKDLTTDTKKSLDDWINCALKPYHLSEPMDPCPDFIREVAFFCCQNIKNMKEIGLSPATITLGHKVAANRFGDKDALKWLISNPFDKYCSTTYLWNAVDAKIPLALRLEADRISSKSFISPKAQQKAQAEIAKLLMEAAEGGDAEAQCRQGETLLKDKSPEDWRNQACEWFLKAANQGHERATVHLGQLFAEEKPMEAIQWLKKVAKNTEADAALRASAECELGKLYLRRQQLADAANHLRTAAQNNNRAAMKLLALEPNLRGTLSDEEIQKWCLSLLKQKETDGQDDKSFRSQVLTRLGQVAKSKTERADWFRQAAEAGDGPGAYEWARCLLFDGKLQEANTWFQEAQKRCQGHLLAAQADAWYKCVYSMIFEPIPPVPAQKRRELFIKTEPRP